MNQDEFKKLYEEEKPMHDAWGGFVIHYIDDELKKSLTAGETYDEFIKIKPSHRTKTVDSIIAKAFIRKKGKYTDPYNEITDKVGTRFVVLLTAQLERLKDIVENCHKWTHSLDRDFEDEKNAEPRMFDYQSLHYIVKASETFEHNSVTIKEGTPCEVQIRTLMQHAYAELAHDTIYKGSAVAEPGILRKFSKGMALMETTDDLLCDAKSSLDIANRCFQDWAEAIRRIFDEFMNGKIECEYESKNMDFILEEMRDVLRKYKVEDFETFYNEPANSYINDKIIERAERNIEFRQPFILLIYFLSKKNRINTYSTWPLDTDILDQIYSDLGISPPE